MRRLSWAVCVLALSATGLRAADPMSVRVIPGTFTEDGVGESREITTRQELDAFLAESYGKRADLQRAVVTTPIDFNSEKLVLIRHEEASDAVRVSLERPLLIDGTLTCTIHRETPAECGATPARYWLAVVVRKGDVRQVTVNVGTPVLLPAGEERSEP